jgi:hypothetical protein
VSVEVVALPDPEDPFLFGEEVELAVDLVLRVRKEELHGRGVLLWA